MTFIKGRAPTYNAGAKAVDAPGNCRSNHEVIAELGKRLGVSHDGFNVDAANVLRRTLQDSERPSLDKFLRIRGSIVSQILNNRII